MPAKSPKKPSAPKQPKKPTSKSKTGNSACSQAASNWQLAIRGKEPLDPNTYKTLAQCRSMSSQKKAANLAVHSGKLTEQGRDALVGRLQKRADQGLLYKKDREARLNMLLKERKAKQAAAPKQAENKSLQTNEVPQRHRVGKDILGPTGAKITGYHWESHLEERWSHREDGLVLKRVSNWDNAGKSQGTNRSIVHHFYVTHPDGRQTIEGIGSAKKILGINESRLKTIAKNEASAQRYRHSQNLAEVKRKTEIAQSSYFGANHDFRGRLGNSPQADAIYDNSKTYRKDGKFLRVKNELSDAMTESGWKVYDRKDRSAKAAQKWADRKAKQQPPAQPKSAAPVSREAALVQKVRGLPGYGVAKASATANRELVGFRMKEKAKPAATKAPAVAQRVETPKTYEQAYADRLQRKKDADIVARGDYNSVEVSPEYRRQTAQRKKDVRLIDQVKKFADVYAMPLGLKRLVPKGSKFEFDRDYNLAVARPVGPNLDMSRGVHLTYVSGKGIKIENRGNYQAYDPVGGRVAYATNASDPLRDRKAKALDYLLTRAKRTQSDSAEKPLQEVVKDATGITAKAFGAVSRAENYKTVTAKNGQAVQVIRHTPNHNRQLKKKGTKAGLSS